MCLIQLRAHSLCTCNNVASCKSRITRCACSEERTASTTAGAVAVVLVLTLKIVSTSIPRKIHFEQHSQAPRDANALCKAMPQNQRQGGRGKSTRKPKACPSLLSQRTTMGRKQGEYMYHIHKSPVST